MAGYNDTKELIIKALMGRPVGTEIQPEDQQAYELNMLDYIHSVELVSSSTLMGLAEATTTPVQPNDSRVCYIAGVAQNQTVTFQNFIDNTGNPITITTGDMQGLFVIFLWNTEHWAAYTFDTTIISNSENATFYYNYNIRKTYSSVAAMNADNVNPVGTDGRLIKIGDLVTVVDTVSPASNGYYSRIIDGWQLQSSFNFQVEQVRSQNINTAPSSKLFDLYFTLYYYYYDKKLPLVWTNEKYIISGGGVGSDVNYQATLDYYPVIAGQKLQCNIAVSGVGDIVAIYDVNKNFVEAKSGTNFEITFAYDGFIRFSNDKRVITTPVVENIAKKYTELINKLNILSDKDVKLINKNSFTPFAKQTSLLNFIPSTPKIDLAYRGQINNKKRYLAVSFDDLSDSDISWVIPLFNKYGFKSTFNRINYGVPNDLDISRYSAIINGGHEIGDHTITHQMYPFYSPLFNGQNPNSLDGTQQPFPTNADLKNDRGDGKNIFGKTITDIVNFGYAAPVFTISWQNLSDSQCQQIRDVFSLYRDETLLPLMDSLSNELLGTTGNSFGSWNGTKYTGGIFSDCKTSSNHEVWERICLIQFLYYKKYFGMNFDFAQWSLPGSRNSYLYFEENGKYYYDRGKTQFANDLGKLQSSYITDNAGILKIRSWIDILREFGYKMTHDALFPGRNDGNVMTEFAHHLILNSSLSKKDALIYPTERTIPWFNYSAYNEAFFNGISNYGKKMYDHRVNGEDGFYNAIENIRNKTANGIIAGCVWDSADTFEEKIYWEEILKFCKATGIEVITKSEAFDIAFNNVVEIGNLIYNPELRNSVKEYFPDANFTNRPDGYYGDCILEVDEITNENILYVNYVNDLAYYSHYGIPHGNLKFSCSAKGSGNIWIFAIRNNTVLGEQSDLLSSISIEDANYTDKNSSFFVKNEPVTSYEGVYEGLSNKICGLKIMYNGIIRVKNMSLIKI